MKILTVVGARPQFIKAAPVCKALREAGHTEYLVHTGQHYDHNMSQIFFDELEIPKPNINLNVGSGSHGKQTGEMLAGIEEAILERKPDWVLVYGDTNSTLAGALAAVKLHVPVAHVEAGLRSFNREMPEEHNRVLTDHCTDLLFCPTQTAVGNLAKEGITHSVYFVGDTMYDAVLQFGEIAEKSSNILQRLSLEPQNYYLATIHRPYNTDIPDNLQAILCGLQALDKPVIFLVHPRTSQKIEHLSDFALHDSTNLQFVSPVGYLDSLMLLKNASRLLTDSGGMQKEAYFFGVPCVTLRSETEWVEIVEQGWNILISTDQKDFVRKLTYIVTEHIWPRYRVKSIFGNGKSSWRIQNTMVASTESRMIHSQTPSIS